MGPLSNTGHTETMGTLYRGISIFVHTDCTFLGLFLRLAVSFYSFSHLNIYLCNMRIAAENLIIGVSTLILSILKGIGLLGIMQ